MSRAPSSAAGPGAGSGQGSAPGKVILLGEHAVVYGHPALAGALSQRIFVEVAADAAGPCVYLTSGESAPAELVSAFGAMAAELGLGASLRATVRTELPLGGGLGSSAALGVALARALCEAAGQPCPPGRAAYLALHLERVFHGAPSGVDPAVCALGGLILFTRAQGSAPEAVVTLAPGRPLHVLVALTGIARGTRRTVLPLAARREERPALYDPLLSALGELARGGADALVRGDLADLGVRFDAAHGILAALGVSCTELDELCAALRRDGALGAKLTGAGGGGAALALAQDAAQARVLEQKARARGVQCFAARLGPEAQSG